MAAISLPIVCCRQPLEVESAALGAALQAAAAASGQDVAEYISINPPAMSQEVGISISVNEAESHTFLVLRSV